MSLSGLVIFASGTKLFQQGSSSAFQFTFAFTRGGIPSGLEKKTANEPSVPLHLTFLTSRKKPARATDNQFSNFVSTYGPSFRGRIFQSFRE